MENLNEVKDEKIVEEAVVEETTVEETVVEVEEPKETEEVKETEEIKEVKKTDEKFWGMEEDFFGTVLQLSRLSVLGVGPIGLLLPIIMWATTKNKSDFINKIGKNVLNWMISYTIYAVILLVCMASDVQILRQISVVLAGGLIIADIFFAVKGAVEANNGNAYDYPGTIKLIK